MTGRRDTWWGRLLFKEKPPEVMPSGLVRWERMDERFRERCAVWSDGRVLIADGYANDVELRALLVELQRTGAVRGQLREEMGTLQEVAEVWRGNRVRDESLDVNPRIVEGLVAIFEEAARARASDVVLEKGPDDCRVFAIVNDRKLPLGNPMTVREAEQVFGFLFFVRRPGQPTGPGLGWKPKAGQRRKEVATRLAGRTLQADIRMPMSMTMTTKAGRRVGAKTKEVRATRKRRSRDPGRQRRGSISRREWQARRSSEARRWCRETVKVAMPKKSAPRRSGTNQRRGRRRAGKAGRTRRTVSKDRASRHAGGRTISGSNTVTPS